MSMTPLKISCELLSPVVGDSLQLDSMLIWELSFRMGLADKITRDISLKDEKEIPIPLSKRKINDTFVWCVSDPICKLKGIDVVKYTKRFPTDDANLLREKDKKSLLIASGNYKAAFNALQTMNIEKIVWFAHGDRRECHKLLKKITAIGKNRNMGFGKVSGFEIEVIDEDHSIESNGVLMKTVPSEYVYSKKLSGYRLSYGGHKPPYWQPDNYREVAIPC